MGLQVVVGRMGSSLSSVSTLCGLHMVLCHLDQTQPRICPSLRVLTHPVSLCEFSFLPGFLSTCLTIRTVKMTPPVNPLSTACCGHGTCYPHSTCLHFHHTLVTPLPSFLHSLPDFVPGFGATVSQLQRQIKAAGSSNPKSTSVFPLPPVLNCLENKFPPLLHLYFISHILPKEQMWLVLLTSPDTQRNHGSPRNLPRVTRPVRSKSEI